MTEMLFLLFGVRRVLAKPRAILLQLQLLTTWLTLVGVVVVAALVTDEENRFGFFLTSGHRRTLNLNKHLSFLPSGGRGLLHAEGDLGK